MVYQKAPPKGENFGEVSESQRLLRDAAAPVNVRRLKLNLMMHPLTQKVAYLVNDHLLDIPIEKFSGLDQKWHSYGQYTYAHVWACTLIFILLCLQKA